MANLMPSRWGASREKGYAQRRSAKRDAGAEECCVTEVECAKTGLVFGPLRHHKRCVHLSTSGVSPLSLLTFFAAAKKVSAAPHRGNANRPLRMQGKAKTKKEKPHEPEDPQGNNTTKPQR